VFPPFRAEDYRQEVHAQVYACLAKNQVGSIISRDVHVRAGKTAEFCVIKNLVQIFTSGREFFLIHVKCGSLLAMFTVFFDFP
jgi:hypothetical protein